MIFREIVQQDCPQKVSFFVPFATTPTTTATAATRPLKRKKAAKN